MPTTEQLNGYVERFYKEVMNGKKGNLFTRVEWLLCSSSVWDGDFDIFFIRRHFRMIGLINDMLPAFLREVD